MSHKNGKTDKKSHVVTKWDVTPKEAVAIQRELRSRVSITSYKGNIKKIKTIAGADVSFNKYSEIIYAGIIVFSYPDFQVIERSLVKTKTKFPYIPGLLSFREIPALLEAWKKLRTEPDLVMVDGQGICHPRRLGIATHFGLSVGVPTIGAAKSLLTGEFKEPPAKAGGVSNIYDKNFFDGSISSEATSDKKEIIGAAVRTKNNVKPIIVSPGNGISRDEAVQMVLDCCRGYRLPEPTRQAHLIVNEFRCEDLGRNFRV